MILVVLFAILALLFGAFVAAAILIKRIVRPTILEYPWPKGADKDKDKLVVLAGSFNPPHKGHLALIRYLSRRYGRVLVVIGFNPSKKYAVTPQERQVMINKMLDGADCYNVGVKGEKAGNLLCDVCWLTS
jgi:cytidyltransferase-like protein